ncbi:MAG TPA: hypothetical protein VJ810_21870 [Blastocatellia bacterium]|nr:hypothetical protein [Blastocatellia bacterium]
MTRRVLQSSIVVIAALIAIACSSKSANPIVGKWKDVEKTAIVEFSKDGSLSISDAAFSMKGNYKFLDEGRVQVNIIGMEAMGPTILTVKFTGGELSLTDPKGEVSRYKRV